MKHCLVPIGEYVIPLIGIPQDAGLDKCDKCKKTFNIWKLKFDGKQFLCNKCLKW
jgi:hypothetical protein